MAIIYKSTCLITNKSYIGKTKGSLEYRIKKHKERLKVNDNNKFRNALRKYGMENFKWEILENINNLCDLNIKEKFYIEKFNTNKNGYNSTLGGDWGDTWSHLSEEEKIERKLKISQKLKGHFVSDRTRNRIINMNKDPNFIKANKKKLKGRTLSEQRKKQISELTRAGMTKEVRKKISDSKKGKTWEEIFGTEKAFQMKEERRNKKRDTGGKFI